MVPNTIGCALVALLATVPTTMAHSYVEDLYLLDDKGAFTGKPGYAIGWVSRTTPGFGDAVVQNKIIDTAGNPPVCKSLSLSNTDLYPPLTASAGDYIAMQYQENGHVSQPDLTKRPYRSGNVYVYGTLEHQDSDGINDVLNSWNAEGTGGNKKGKLIASHYYDDDQCYQNNPATEVWQTRSKKNGGLSELWCQTDIQLPTDLPDSGTYTLMWVWDWPNIIDDTHNSTEIYTSCAQINLSGSSANSKKAKTIKFASDNKMPSAGIASQINTLIEATALGVGQSSPAPVTISQPAATGSAQGSTSTSSKKGNDDHIKTVTVTADAATVTQYTTVTAGAPTSAPTNTATSVSDARPSVSGFLSARLAGHRRRQAASS
ncbi:hypothetical protein GGR57DRAFT_391184 [Xylariaceae sp. FL1272]|nr:hypothetical protein GGR57DRAFT_391184 [Xylariaceae sp. FL1272]